MGLNVYNSDTQLSATAATCVTCSASSQITFTKVTLCNTDTVAHTFTIYRVPLGGTASSANALATTSPIGAGETVTAQLSGATLTAGQTLQALASTASVVNLSASWCQTP